MSLLPRRIDNIGVFGVNGAGITVSTISNKPITVHDAVDINGARRPHLAAVVLGAAVNIVKGQRIVQSHPVKLGYW